MWKLDCKKTWAPKNWCFWTVVLEKTLESPLDCKEIQPVHSEGDQPWHFFGRNDAKAETPIGCPPNAKHWLIWKDPDAGKDWGREEKGMTEDEMVGWHHRLDGHGFGWTPGVGDWQGGLACCSSWGHKESDMTKQMNWLLVTSVSFLPLLYVTMWTSLGVPGCGEHIGVWLLSRLLSCLLFPLFSSWSPISPSSLFSSPCNSANLSGCPSLWRIFSPLTYMFFHQCCMDGEVLRLW